MARIAILGYSDRYTTDGVSVYRGKVKLKKHADGFHMVPNGSTNFDRVTAEIALSGGKVVEVAKPKKTAKRKRK